jgi:hypothetical protein
MNRSFFPYLQGYRKTPPLFGDAKLLSRSIVGCAG